MGVFIITGIGTEIGKTIVSAVVVEYLNAYYWKPIQTGLDSDSKIIASLVSNPKIIPERYKLKLPASPHQAAEEENITISQDNLQLPNFENNLIIESAGGVMVPLNNDGLLFIDLIKMWKAKVILVSKNYLGSINHTLLTYEALKTRNIDICGIVFNGEPNFHTENIIQKHTKLPVTLKMHPEKIINKKVIQNYANQIQWKV